MGTFDRPAGQQWLHLQEGGPFRSWIANPSPNATDSALTATPQSPRTFFRRPARLEHALISTAKKYSLRLGVEESNNGIPTPPEVWILDLDEGNDSIVVQYVGHPHTAAVSGEIRSFGLPSVLSYVVDDNSWLLVPHGFPTELALSPLCVTSDPVDILEMNVFGHFSLCQLRKAATLEQWGNEMTRAMESRIRNTLSAQLHCLLSADRVISIDEWLRLGRMPHTESLL